MGVNERLGCHRFAEVGDVPVFHVDLRRNPAREAEAAGWLDKADAERRARFRSDGADRQFTLCRAALRSCLCRVLGCPNDQLAFGFSRHGKPFALVAGIRAPIHFNLAHSGTHGLIAYSFQSRVGIDIEIRQHGRDFEGIAERVFGPEERAVLDRASGWREIEIFYRLWTMKEALIKAIGTGFSLDPSTFEVPTELLLRRSRSARFGFPGESGQPWTVHDLCEGRFAAAAVREIGS